MKHDFPNIPCVNSCIILTNWDMTSSKCTCIYSVLVTYTMSESVETWKGYVYAILMFVTAIGNSLLLQSLFKLSYDAGGRAKAGIVSMIYKKVWID